MVGHDVDIFDCESVLMNFTDATMVFQVIPIQASYPYTCGWLIGCHLQTFNCNNFTKLLQAYPKLKKIHICYKKRHIKLGKEDKYVWDNYGFKQSRQEILVLKTIFNRNKDYHIKERLEGLDLKFIEYYGDPISPDPDTNQILIVKKPLSSKNILGTQKKKF